MEPASLGTTQTNNTSTVNTPQSNRTKATFYLILSFPLVSTLKLKDDVTQGWGMRGIYSLEMTEGGKLFPLSWNLLGDISSSSLIKMHLSAVLILCLAALLGAQAANIKTIRTSTSTPNMCGDPNRPHPQCGNPNCATQCYAQICTLNSNGQQLCCIDGCPFCCSVSNGFIITGTGGSTNQGSQTGQLSYQPSQGSFQPGQGTVGGFQTMYRTGQTGQSGNQGFQTPYQTGTQSGSSGTQNNYQPAQTGSQTGQGGYWPNQGTTTQTGQNGYQPNQGTSQNSQNGYQPNQGTSQTSQNGYQPNQGTSQTSQNGYQPNTGSSQSSQNGYQPNQGTGQTSQNGYQPNQDQAGYQRRQSYY